MGKVIFKFLFVYLNVIFCTGQNSLQSCHIRDGKSLRHLMCLNPSVGLPWYLEKDMYLYYVFCLHSAQHLFGKGSGTIFCNLCLLVSLHITQGYCSCIHNMHFIVIPWQTIEVERKMCILHHCIFHLFLSWFSFSSFSSMEGCDDV